MSHKNLLLVLLVVIAISPACEGLKSGNENRIIPVINTANTSTNRAAANNSDTTTAEDTTTDAVEKTKPAAGKGNLQGKVMFNDKPVEGINVKLCEQFSMIGGIRCSGKTVAAKTEADGTYVLADVDPKEYQGIMAQVFKSDLYISPQESLMTPQKFNVEPDKTIFVKDINLFKDDLKLVNPKSGAKVDAKTLEFKWDAYPEAAYYKFSMYSENAQIQAPYYNERIDDTTFAVDKPLTNGRYWIKLEAFNSNNRKLAQNDSSIRFSVTGGEEPPPAS